MPFELSLEEGKFLVNLARNAVKEYLETRKTIKPPENISRKLLGNRGVFITINYLSEGLKKLRGCIGYPYPISPLLEAVINSAISAATQDPRFSPLALNELEKVVFEISVLTSPAIISVQNPKDYPDKIKIGEDGLIIEKGFRKGLLLPQVPIEWNWSEEDFLCQCCIKAGLSPDSWIANSVKIYKFQAIVFGEETPQGEVKRLQLNTKHVS